MFLLAVNKNTFMLLFVPSTCKGLNISETGEGKRELRNTRSVSSKFLLLSQFLGGQCTLSIAHVVGLGFAGGRVGGTGPRKPD